MWHTQTSHEHGTREMTQGKLLVLYKKHVAKLKFHENYVYMKFSNMINTWIMKCLCELLLIKLYNWKYLLDRKKTHHITNLQKSLAEKYNIISK